MNDINDLLIENNPYFIKNMIILDSTPDPEAEITISINDSSILTNENINAIKDRTIIIDRELNERDKITVIFYKI